MTLGGVHFNALEIAGGLSMAAAYFVPLFCGVGIVRSIMLGAGWQLFLLTLISILFPGRSS